MMQDWDSEGLRDVLGPLFVGCAFLTVMIGGAYLLGVDEEYAAARSEATRSSRVSAIPAPVQQSAPVVLQDSVPKTASAPPAPDTADSKIPEKKGENKNDESRVCLLCPGYHLNSKGQLGVMKTGPGIKW